MKYQSLARAGLWASLKTNTKEIGLTAWYGSLGVAYTVGAPLIGNINGFLATISAGIPLFARWNQTTDMAETNEHIANNKWNYYGKAAAKALVNVVMLAVTAAVATTYGSVAASWLLGSWCVSKMINLGDGSPIEHFENYFSNNDKSHPSNRTSLLTSLGANIANTSKGLFYGSIAMAATVGLPVFGSISLPVAGLIFALPFIIRTDQINIMSESITEQQQKYYRANALVSTIVDAAIGFVIYSAATLSGFNPQITGGVLAGWIGAKLSSGGENSPLEHLTKKTAVLLGADENIVNNMVRGGHVDRLEASKSTASSLALSPSS
jgi:hypothetical protein